MQIKLDPGAYMPERAHETDAGWDLRSPEAVTIRPGMSAVIDTGVHIAIPAGCCGLLVSKSGLNVRYGVQSTGLIDAGYTGAIWVRLDNHSLQPYEVERGDKISQIVFLPVHQVDELEPVAHLEETERGAGGFGSSGK